MTIRTALVALVLGLSPAAAFAMGGCMSERQTSASACGEGMVWDSASQTCIAPMSS